MTRFVRVAGTREVPRGQGRAFEVNGRPVALFNSGGKFYAIEGRCKHQGGPLSEGALEARVVTCPWHGWTYDVTTGASPEDPAICVERFELRVEGEDILIAV